MASRYWSRDLFKGRIGGAIIEAVLSEFGYQVERAECKQGAGDPQIHPDFLVTHPQWAQIVPSVK